MDAETIVGGSGLAAAAVMLGRWLGARYVVERASEREAAR